MANSISLFKKYIDKLDEVYKQASLTADLDADSTLVQAGANANEIIIPKMSMDGLGNYSRSDGYAQGDVTLTNETVQFNYERGRKFGVDRQDNAESETADDGWQGLCADDNHGKGRGTDDDGTVQEPEIQRGAARVCAEARGSIY